MLKKIYFIFGLLISVVFVYLVLRGTDITAAVNKIQQTNLWFFGLALLFTLAGLFVRSVRWHYILSPNQKIDIYSLWQATCIGLTVNNILPFRAGDLAQAAFLGQQRGISKSLILSTVIIERLVDLTFPLLTVLTASFFLVLPDEISISRIVIVTVTLFLLGLFSWRYRQLIKNVILNIFRTGHLNTKVSRLVENFSSGFGVLKNKPVLLRVVLFTVMLWLLYSATSFAVLKSIDIELPVFAAILITAVTSIGVAIPSSPGYIGTWEFFGVLALRIFRIDKSTALSFAVLYHLSQYLLVNLLGIFVLLRSGISFVTLSKPLPENDK